MSIAILEPPPVAFYGVRRMDEFVKAIWVYELRSGKYPQTTDALRIGDSFCALGVLCDLFAKATGRGHWGIEPGEEAGYEGSIPFVVDPTVECGEPPAEVCEWAGFYDPQDNSWIDPNPNVNGKPISVWNDKERLPFAELADLIEAHL